MKSEKGRGRKIDRQIPRLTEGEVFVWFREVWNHIKKMFVKMNGVIKI